MRLNHIALKYILIYLTIFAYGLSLSAQNKSGKISGKVFIISNSAEKSGGHVIFINKQQYNIIPVPDAVVELIIGKDTLRTVSRNDGIYTFNKVPYGNHLIKPRHLLYVASYQRVDHHSSQTSKDLQMKEEEFILDEIKVKGEIPLLTTKGDTVIINPLAVKTMEGDAAIEILRQVPGVKINDESGVVYLFGEVLRRTYVNGRLIFGYDAKAALDNLDASLVKKMKVYDELSDITMTEDGNFEAKTRRVLNIETTIEILSSRTGHAELGAGQDLKYDNENNNIRYRAGATINFFSENLLYSVNVFTNNTNNSNNKINDLQSFRIGPGEQKIANAGLKLQRVFKYQGGLYLLNFNYNYHNSRSRQEKTLENNYFPSEQYIFRKYSSQDVDLYNQRDHIMMINSTGALIPNKKIQYTVSHNMIIGDSDYSGRSIVENRVNNNIDLLNKERNNNIRRYQISDNLSLTGRNIRFGFSSNINKDNGETWSTDTSFSNSIFSGERVFISSPVGSGIKLAADAGCSWDKFPLSFNYKIEYQKSKRREIRYNLDDSMSENPDELNSYDYSLNNTTHIAQIGYNLSIAHKKKKRSVIKTSVSLQASSVNKNEALPLNLNYSKPFNALLFNINYTYQSDYSNLFSPTLKIKYTTSTSIPSVEQLRDQVTDTDPLFLTAGNSRLKQSYSHNFSANFLVNNPEISLDLKTSLISNSIVPRQRFFIEETVLPEFNNYIAPANSTLQTYDNLSGEVMSSFTTDYSTRISLIKSTLSISSDLKYNRKPSYIRDAVNITNRFSGLLKIGLSANFPRAKLVLNSSSEYVKAVNTRRNDSEYFNQNIKFSYDYNIGKYLFSKGNYNLVLYEPLTKNATGYTNNILSLSGGIRLIKGSLLISFSVFDILNKSTDFRTIMYSDYVQNTWTPTLGRYFSFNILFKFRSVKTPPLRLDDGSVPTFSD